MKRIISKVATINGHIFLAKIFLILLIMCSILLIYSIQCLTPGKGARKIKLIMGKYSYRC